jgi:hypothetical protein
MTKWKPLLPAAVVLMLAAGLPELAARSLSARGFPPRNDPPVLSGPYLGQTPPGTTPAVFAPGVVSTGLYTRDIAISKSGDEIFFCVADGGLSAIFVTRLAGGRWTEPAIAPFSGTGFLDFEPHLSPDGKQLFFLSSRPPSGQKPGNGWFYQHIWATTRTDEGWSEPLMVPAPVNSEDNEFFPSVTKDNVLYFTRSKKNGSARIYRAKLENGRYAEPEMLPFTVPEKGLLFNAFVSPQEDFLITCALNIEAANADQDYYVSFRMPDGGWSALVRFGPEINAPGDNANSAFVSPDGRFLFFGSSRKDPSKPGIKSGTTLRDIIRSKSEPGSGSSAIYWVSSKIIKDLKPK